MQRPYSPATIDVNVPTSSSPGLHSSQIPGPSNWIAPLICQSCPAEPPVCTPADSASINGTNDSYLSTSIEVPAEFSANNRAVWFSPSQENCRTREDSQEGGVSCSSQSVRPVPLMSPPVTAPSVSASSGVANVREILRPLFLEIVAKSKSPKYPVARWVEEALSSELEEWGNIIEDILAVIFPTDERKYPRQVRKHVERRFATRAPPNRNARKAAEYKKAQDLYGRNPRALADAITSNEVFADDPMVPSMEEVMEVHGKPFELPSIPDSEPFTPPVKQLPNSFTPITPKDVCAAKKGWRVAAPGCDGVSIPQVVRCSDNTLAILFNLVLASAYHPPDWMLLRTILIPKSGKDRRHAANWRPITIGSAVQRLLHRVLLRRLVSLVDLDLNQRGFVAVDGCLSNMLILDALMAERTAARKGIAMVSLDIKKAFDSVSHESVRRALRRVGVPDYLFHYISSTLNDSVTSISVGSSTSRVVQINRGVRQGDPLSPFLFNVVLDELLVRLESHGSIGCPFRNGTRCRVLAFADDLVVIGEKVADLNLCYELKIRSSYFGFYWHSRI
ncbi:hypothetical protein Zmor_003573 [Zophobas morio]|uniref:Reverse transcriptase domain-containing protein n=1 Tax=Zophobas morio TaxID=2755281 RepID=A0AA38HMU9_9CUCU|nr:hypothetical protein Zmor_003573 [Zophobas morio]